MPMPISNNRLSRFYLWPILFAFCVAAGPATQPATLSTNSTTDEILDALDARGENLQDFSANIVLTDSDNATGSSTSNTGTILFQRKGQNDARIRVAFTKKQVENHISAVDHQYTLDNGLLDDRDYKQNVETKTQVLKPGEKLDLFKLGEGPFPLPLGQKKEDVYHLFKVEKIKPDPSDPAQTVHLQLTPKNGTRFARKFQTIDIWVNTMTGMPSRIQTIDVSNSTTRTTDLSNIRLNTGLADKDFSPPPMPPNTDITEGPYSQ
jgi:outer membrane lipoprotein-sorting protein